MIETKFEIPTTGAETFLYRPDDIAEFPGVVFLTDIWGIRPATIGMAKRLADKGFAVLLPNVMHRYSRITPDGLQPESEEERNKALPTLFATLTPADMESDGKTYVDSCWRRRA
jgi:carboxymethylenebutenolidase